MVLNQTLAEQGLMPLEVTRTITASGTFGRERSWKSRPAIWSIGRCPAKTANGSSTLAIAWRQVPGGHVRRVPHRVSAGSRGKTSQTLSQIATEREKAGSWSPS
jgi:hypothetical protein